LSWEEKEMLGWTGGWGWSGRWERKLRRPRKGCGRRVKKKKKKGCGRRVKKRTGWWYLGEEAEELWRSSEEGGEEEAKCWWC
jgi:hypothetical protein